MASGLTGKIINYLLHKHYVMQPYGTQLSPIDIKHSQVVCQKVPADSSGLQYNRRMNNW